MELNCDIAVIGGGPAGYTAAIRAAQRGFSVIVFEKDCMGGVCLNRGCIPTKAILHCTDYFKALKKAEKFGVVFQSDIALSVDYDKIYQRKNDIVSKINKSLTKLVESYGINIVLAEAELKSEKEIIANDNIYHCKNIIIATGSEPAQINGLCCDGEFVYNSNQILELNTLPNNILIVGSGAIGVEWARIFSAIGCSVTVVEVAENLLPVADIDVSKRLERLFKKDKIKFYTSTGISKIEGNSVYLDNNQVLTPDLVLCAVGRRPIVPKGLNFATNNGFIEVDYCFRTNYDSVFAVGDVNGKLQLAHSATHQAIAVVDFIATNSPIHFDKNKIPSVIYGNPEIAWVGLTEQSLAEQKLDYKSSMFPVAALGKALADDEIEGFVKVLAVDNKIVGAHAVTPEASAIIQQFVLMIDNKMDITQVLKTTFAHPTYSEATFESILGLDLGSINLPPVNQNIVKR